MQRYNESEMWYKKAIKEAPYLRDPYVELAILYYELEDWENVSKYIKKALKIMTHQKTYINEIFSWNETPYDLLSLYYYHKGEYKTALKYIYKALKYNSDERLLNNKELILKKINTPK